jgi:hypothetical protein
MVYFERIFRFSSIRTIVLVMSRGYRRLINREIPIKLALSFQ